MYEMLRKIYFWSNRVFCLSLCIICILCPGARFTYNCIAFFINDQLRTKWLKNIVKGFNMNVLKNTDDDRGFINLSLNFNVQYIYIQLCFYFTIVSVRNKNQKWVWFSLQMVEEMPENADTSDNLLALIEQTQQCLVLLNNAECMFYSGLICLHALSLCPSVCVSLFVVLPSVACSFLSMDFFFQRVHWVLIFWTFD